MVCNPARDQAGHLPIGQASWSIRLLAPVKQPQILQRKPVWCSQVEQILSRCRWISGGVVRNPEPANCAMALVAERAMRRSPGPVVDCAGAAPDWLATTLATSDPPR